MIKKILINTIFLELIKLLLTRLDKKIIKIYSKIWNYTCRLLEGIDLFFCWLDKILFKIAKIREKCIRYIVKLDSSKFSLFIYSCIISIYLLYKYKYYTILNCIYFVVLYTLIFDIFNTQYIFYIFYYVGIVCLYAIYLRNKTYNHVYGMSDFFYIFFSVWLLFNFNNIYEYILILLTIWQERKGPENIYY